MSKKILAGAAFEAPVITFVLHNTNTSSTPVSVLYQGVRELDCERESDSDFEVLVATET